MKPLDMVVLNEMDRVHLVEDVLDRVPLNNRSAYAKQAWKWSGQQTA